MKWLVFVEGGHYSGSTGEEGTRVIEIEDGPSVSACSSARDVWNRIREQELCDGSMNDVKLDGLKGTRLRVFKAEEIIFPFLDDYVVKREAQETQDRDTNKREAEETKLRDLAAKLGFKVEKA